jgi:hypothetical protein
LNKKEIEEIKQKENFEDDLEEKIEENKTEKVRKNIEPFIVNIPSNAKKEDLNDLKEFLLKQESGFIKVFINFKGQDIDTKISIFDTCELETWIKNKWN